MMQSYWREATSVMLLAPSSSLVNPNNEKINNCDNYTDYKVLTVNGNKESIYMKSSYVFPGGQLYLSDFSARWWTVFDNCGITLKDVNAWIDIAKPRPPIITESLTLEEIRRCSIEEDDFVTIDMALRLSAIRHMFKESGILLVNKRSIRNLNQLSVEEINHWREKVIESPFEFVKMCLKYNLCPDLWSLYEWWNWLTPWSVGKNPRYDTLLFICFVNNILTQSNGQWSSPQKLINDNLMGKYILSPTQVYELSKLQNFNSISSVYDLAKKRQQLGIDRWLPVLSMYKDGAISVLPGDDYYPSYVDILTYKPVRSYSQTVDEIRKKTSRLNRLELRAPSCKVVCNIDLPRGHLRPLNTITSQNVIDAKL